MTMFHWIDLALFFLLLSAAWIGYRQGFLRQLFNLLSLVIALVAAWAGYQDLAHQLASLFSIPVLKITVGSLELGMLPLKILSFLLLFFAVRLLIRWLGSLLGIVHAIPVLSTVNRWLGLCLSVMKTALILFLLFSLISLFPGLENTISGSWMASKILEWSPEFIQLAL